MSTNDINQKTCSAKINAKVVNEAFSLLVTNKLGTLVKTKVIGRGGNATKKETTICERISFDFFQNEMSLEPFITNLGILDKFLKVLRTQEPSSESSGNFFKVISTLKL